MRPRVRFAFLVLSVVVSTGTNWVALGQATTTPSAHFGALLFPRDQPGYELGLHFNRFTEFDKETKTVDGVETPVRYNHIDKTYGFNLVAFSVTSSLASAPDYLVRATVQTGITHNQPTSYLQNEIIHSLRNIPHVPVGEAPTRFEADVAVDIFRRLGTPDGTRVLFGGGASAGTIYHDAHVQAGFRSAAIIAGRRPLLAVSSVVRAGVPAGSAVFKSDHLAETYAMGQASGATGWIHDWTRGVLPVAELGISYSTGLFEDESGAALSEVFWTIRLSWSDWFAFETWNDSLKGKDRGPTYGLRLTTAFTTIPSLDGLFGIRAPR